MDSIAAAQPQAGLVAEKIDSQSTHTDDSSDNKQDKTDAYQGGLDRVLQGIANGMMCFLVCRFCQDCFSRVEADPFRPKLISSVV